VDLSYTAVLGRKQEILVRATGIDYPAYERSPVAFDYEGLMSTCDYSFEEVGSVLAETGVGETPLVELKNITELVRGFSPPGKGGRIFVKDEAANASGSFKDRRAALSIHDAFRKEYQGVVAASSGNYGAAVASQAAKRGLRAIILQEVYDSRQVGQPEILEKTRACEAYGAEVWQLTVGPELFYIMLRTLEETGYYAASLYVPTGVLGVETLGYEIARQVHQKEGKFPEMVVITHAGGGNVTGTARGLRRAGADQTEVVGVSVDLKGLHMASDHDFNRKSFTTGHSGYGIPFATWPDRTDVPRNCARALRYLDRYVLVRQGDVFFVTEMLAKLEGMERGPAGNTSLAGALVLAQELDRDQILVVQETEYTAAGKLPSSQLTFAVQNGVEVKRGNPEESVPGQSIIVPQDFGQIKIQEWEMDKMRRSYVRNASKAAGDYSLTDDDIRFLAEDSSSSIDFVQKTLAELNLEPQN
jgi:cysteine synthase